MCPAVIILIISRQLYHHQAMIGIAFSLGFTVGPLLGAYFAINSKTTENIFCQTPALLALSFSVADLFFIWLMLPETLTADVKVSRKIFSYINIQFLFKRWILICFLFAAFVIHDGLRVFLKMTFCSF